MRYVPGLDGLRAVAVMLVFLHHTSHFPGWLGSDIFFVLSGYLITAILVAEHEATGAISLLNFYIRRAYRLLPALLIVICVAVGMAVWFHSRVRDTAIDAAAALFYILDYRYVLMSNPAEHWTALSHLWSLSVEEQFYIFWPLLLIVLLRGYKRVALPTILVIIVVINIWRIWCFRTSTPPYYHIYFAFDTRADELMIGCASALWRERGLALWFLKPLWPVLVLILAIVVLKVEPSEALMPVSYALLGAAIACMIIIVTSDERSLLTKMLSLPPVVAFGRISYGFYLWHFLIISEPVIYERLVIFPRTLLTFVLTLVIAVASYLFIERPVVRRRRAKNNRGAVERNVSKQSLTAERSGGCVVIKHYAEAERAEAGTGEEVARTGANALAAIGPRAYTVK